MDNVKISIIMPVYNAAKYLKETIGSVLNQTFQDYELIAVNDGSTDNSLEILNSINNLKIKVINKPNTGVSDTRNVGIDSACGDYVCFLDADDYLSPYYLQYMYQIVKEKNADMVVCNYMPFRGKANFTEQNNVSNHVRSTTTLVQAGVLTSAWTKLIKKSTLYNAQIRFERNMTYGEDLFFCWKSFIASENVWFIDEQLYGYRMTDSGATTKYHAELYEKYKAAFADLKKFSEREHHEMDIFFTTRMPSFIRMTIRENSSISQKKKRLEYILSDTVIQETLQKWDIFEKEIKPDEISFYRQCRNGNINSLLLYGYKSQLRSSLSSIKSKIKG